jgi:hypothetical protein
MPRLLAAALALAVLALAGCGGDTTTTPVEGQTTPPTVATTTTPTTAPTTTTTTAAAPRTVDAAAQFTKLKACVGGKSTETYQWFQPTVDYAAKNGGDGFTVTLKGKPVTLIVFPSAEMAQLGYKDIQDRLIRLQQVRPTDYASVAATAAQPVGNVLEVAQAGPLDPASEATVQGCITQSAA